MKTGIHPDYKDTTFSCACGASHVIKATLGGEMKLEICSQCHPLYTGKQKLIDTAGRIEQFQKRYKQAPAAK